jgi:hypothetical protein
LRHIVLARGLSRAKVQSHLPPQTATPPFAAPNNVSVAPETPMAEAPGAEFFDTNTPEKLITITNADARYTFTSRGGGLKSVELLKYPETISPRWKKEMATNGVATLNTRAPVPVLAILGDAGFCRRRQFCPDAESGDGVRAKKLLRTAWCSRRNFTSARIISSTRA